MFYRGEYDKLLKLVHDQFLEEKHAIKKLKQKLTDGIKERSEEQKQMIQDEIDSRVSL